MSNTYSRFDNSPQAEKVCDGQNECIGIYDESCDEIEPFRLCKIGFKTSVFDTGCIYKKKNTFGKLLLFYVPSA